MEDKKGSKTIKEEDNNPGSSPGLTGLRIAQQMQPLRPCMSFYVRLCPLSELVAAAALAA